MHPLCFIGYFVTVTCWGEISLFALQHAPNTNDAVTASLFAFRQDRDLEMRFYSKKCTKQFTINALQRLHSLKEARFITFGEAETTGEDFKLKTVLNMHSTEPSVLCDLIE